MKVIRLVLIGLLAFGLTLSCAKEEKKMSLEEYSKIEAEINLPDPDLDPELVKEVVNKHGYTVEEYRKFSERVQKDPKLREELGEIRLREQKKDM